MPFARAVPAARRGRRHGPVPTLGPITGPTARPTPRTPDREGAPA